MLTRHVPVPRNFFQQSMIKFLSKIFSQQRNLIYSSSSTKGLRTTMEDVHTIETNIPNFTGYSFFGVYDGHGGKEVAEYISENLHLNIFKKIHEIGEDNIEKAIKDAFVQTDNECKNKVKSKHSGSTAVIAIITPNQMVYVGNTGDSHAVMSDAGSALTLS